MKKRIAGVVFAVLILVALAFRAGRDEERSAAETSFGAVAGSARELERHRAQADRKGETPVADTILFVRPLLDVRDLTIEFPQSLAGRALSSAHPAGLGTTMTGAAAVRSLSFSIAPAKCWAWLASRARENP